MARSCASKTRRAVQCGTLTSQCVHLLWLYPYQSPCSYISVSIARMHIRFVCVCVCVSVCVYLCSEPLLAHKANYACLCHLRLNSCLTCPYSSTDCQSRARCQHSSVPSRRAVRGSAQAALCLPCRPVQAARVNCHPWQTVHQTAAPPEYDPRRTCQRPCVPVHAPMHAST
jgi:hypothetical protein